MRHANVAMFIPHNGCPNKCSFCDQRYITGLKHQVNEKEVKDILNRAKKDLEGKQDNSEIAFFGGSFTAIDRDYMLSLLNVAFEFVKDGSFSGIRISTRPDAIDCEILDILKEKGVSSIELGAQSMDDNVLLLNDRGHTVDDVINSSNLIKEYKFSLGLQMMTGLYGSNFDKDLKTAESIIKLSPDTVRVYPTIIMENTFLAELYRSNKYKTYSLEESIELCAKILRMFRKNKIEVIRLGLHDTETMKENIVSGPWHPAFRELCESQILFEDVMDYINLNNIFFKDIVLYVNPSCVSKFIGQKRGNIIKFSNAGYSVKVKGDSSIKINDFKLEKGR